MLKRKGKSANAKIIKFPVPHKPLSDDISFDRETRQILKDSRKIEKSSVELMRFAEETLKKVAGK